MYWELALSFRVASMQVYVKWEIRFTPVIAGKKDEAEDLATATVHWLRHTAISSEVEYRPREHIRDDVGHENPATMDKYIDTDRLARHQSAQGKKLKPMEVR